MFNANIITNVAWGASIHSSPANSLQIPVNPRAAALRARDVLLSLRCQDHLRRRYNRHNPPVFFQVHRWYNDSEGPVTH